MAYLYTILLLILSNTFMTFAWYGHLRFGHLPIYQKWGMFGVIIISWGVAFFEYCCQVPANRIGYDGNGGPMSLVQLKVLQEVISLTVFTLFTLLLFKNETIRPNHIMGFVFLILTVYCMFKK